MPRRKKPKIERALPTSLAAARQVQGVCDLLRPKPGQVHRNTTLFDHDVFTALLCAFFDPMVRSQRTIGQLSEVPAVQEHLDVDRIARSTLSDALARFRTEALYEVLRVLKRQMPAWMHSDSNVENLLGKLVAIDASYFNMAGDIAWALRQRNVNGVLSRVRLDMQLDVQRWTAEKFAVHGAEMGSEAQAQKQMLEGGVIYLADRLYASYNFVDSVLQPQVSGQRAIRIMSRLRVLSSPKWKRAPCRHRGPLDRLRWCCCPDGRTLAGRDYQPGPSVSIGPGGNSKRAG